jgi:gliding motility-associated-like protein
VVNTATVASLQPDSQTANNTSSFSKEILNLTLPNVITPNGDGRNDTFKILGLNAYPENSMAIYNRWNNEVWRSRGSSYRDEWTGEGLSEGTYFYVLKLKDKTGQWQVVTGWVLLLRN